MGEGAQGSSRVTAVQELDLQRPNQIANSGQKIQGLIPFLLAELGSHVVADILTERIWRDEVGVIAAGRVVVVADSPGSWVSARVERG